MERNVLAMACGSAILGLFLLFLPLQGRAQGVTCPTDSLQGAIDAAAAGSTILVSGTCEENVLILEPKNRITLDGGGTAVISGLDTSNATVTIRGRDITIKGFTITGGFDGIQVERGGTATIDGNTIQATSRYGIGVIQNSYARIVNNTIQNNPDDGILINENSSARVGFLSPDDANPSSNTIQGNGGNGIEVVRSSSARIVGNIISGNTLDGIRVAKASHADIALNTVNGNSEHGIFVLHNSGVNLGNDTGDLIVDQPNTTTVKNKKYGLKCAMGAYMDGRRGSVKGELGVVSVGGGCINSLIP